MRKRGDHEHVRSAVQSCITGATYLVGPEDAGYGSHYHPMDLAMAETNTLPPRCSLTQKVHILGSEKKQENPLSAMDVSIEKRKGKKRTHAARDERRGEKEKWEIREHGPGIELRALRPRWQPQATPAGRCSRPATAAPPPTWPLSERPAPTDAVATPGPAAISISMSRIISHSALQLIHLNLHPPHGTLGNRPLLKPVQ